MGSYMRLKVVLASFFIGLTLSPMARAEGPEDAILRDAVPNKWLQSFLPENLPDLDLPEYIKTSPVELAEAQSWAGRYKLSLITLGKAGDADPLRAAKVKARSLWALGRSDEAVAALAGDKIVIEPTAQILTADILASQGKTEPAIALLKTLLQGHPDSIAGHYQLGRISELAGDLPHALEQYTWFVTAPHNYLDLWLGQGDKAFESAEELTYIGRALDRWASLTSAYKDSVKLNNTILNIFVKAYDVVDRGYWPAHVAAAEYYLSHSDRENAMKELDAAHKANPNDLAVYKLVATVSLDMYNFDGAESAIATMRKVNRKSTDADLLEARNLLQQRRAKEAEEPIQRVLAQQPKNIEAMGLLAATYSLQLHDDKAAAVIKQVEAIDPQNATAYFEVGEQLRAMRQYPRAAAMFKTAVDRAPWWTDARNGLGLLYTQSGDDDLARVTLEAARALDPYNVATTNYMRLMDQLASYTRKETDHFIIAYVAEQDPIIPEYFAEYLESIYADVCGEYKYEPTVKTIIEVHPSHAAFSVRTTGSPWIGTVGASTGRVIAMVSPRKGEGMMGTFNWAQVLRHEFTHTVTLGETDNRIAHWMTEGLAVLQEHSPLRWDWVPMLYSAVSKDQLFDLDNLTWAFVRPKKPSDRQLAYAESFWICQYIEEKWGHDAVLKMLTDFRNGMTQQDAFVKELGKSQSEFFNDFKLWTKAQIATWGYDEGTSKKYDALRAKGESLVQGKQYTKAAAAWEEIVKLRPMDALPHQRLAGLYLTPEVNKPEKAIEHLIVLHQVELKDNRYAKRIAGIYKKIGRVDDAIHYGQQAMYVDPYDVGAHELLQGIYEEAGKTELAEKEKHTVSVIADVLAKRKKEQILGN